MKKLFIPILLLMPVTQAHAIDLTRAPTPDELSKMGAIELCYHAEVRDTAPLSAKIKAEGLQCGPILESAKRILAAREAAAAEDRKQAEATKREQAERDRKAAAERKRQAEIAARQEAERRRLAEERAEQERLTRARAAAERAERERLAALERQRQAQQAQALAEQRRMLAAQQRALEKQRKDDNFWRGMQILQGLAAPPPQPSYTPPPSITCTTTGPASMRNTFCN